MKNDELGSRMKENYENRTRLFLPRRTYTIIRLDGKAFHTFTKGFKRPFDFDLMAIMDATAAELCKSIQGVKFAFTQSDEISLLLTDFESDKTDAWFDGNIQKIVSVSASIATAAFNKALLLQTVKVTGHNLVTVDFLEQMKVAHFDSRTYTIPDKNEVANYFIWRQQDATRNSIQMGAQALYSHKELNGKNTSILQEMMFQKGINWNDYPSSAKRGRCVIKEMYSAKAEGDPRETGGGPLWVWRSKWSILTGMSDSPETPIFTQEPAFLRNLIPSMEKG